MRQPTSGKPSSSACGLKIYFYWLVREHAVVMPMTVNIHGAALLHSQLELSIERTHLLRNRHHGRLRNYKNNT